MDLYDMLNEALASAYDSCYGNDDLDEAMYEYIESVAEDMGYSLRGRLAKAVETEIAQYILRMQEEDA